MPYRTIQNDIKRAGGDAKDPPPKLLSCDVTGSHGYPSRKQHDPLVLDTHFYHEVQEIILDMDTDMDMDLDMFMII